MTGNQGNVDIVENPRIEPGGRRRQMRQETFIARNEGRVDSTKETNTDGVTIAHDRPGTVVMYKPTEHMGYVARTVSASSIRLLIRQGWSEVCPDCGAEHLDKAGNATTNPNACKARPPVAETLCPVCGRRLFDNQGFTSASEKEPDNENLILFDLAAATPRERLQSGLDFHLWAKHPRQAQMMGRPPLPTALREIAESLQSTTASVGVAG